MAKHMVAGLTMNALAMNNEVQSCEHSSVQKCSHAVICACSQRCSLKSVQFDVYSGCKYGFSIRQINILSIIKNNRFPLAYHHISEILLKHFEMDLSADAVRGIIQRLKKNNFIKSERHRLGNRRGNLYTFTTLNCENIPMLDDYINVQSDMQNSTHSNSSILKEIDRNINLSILKEEEDHTAILENLSEDDILFILPNLASHNLGTHQIRQIIERLNKQGKPINNVLQGLRHAEWELENGEMKDKSGAVIESPLDWVFQIIAKQGYYRRPKNYISPEEQAILDERERLESIKKNLAELESMNYEKWISDLSEDEKQAIINERNSGRFRIPESAALKIYYKENILNNKE